MLMNERGEVENTGEEVFSMEDLVNESLEEGAVENENNTEGNEENLSTENNTNKEGENEDTNTENKGDATKDNDANTNKDEDPEIEMDYEEDGQKVKLKLSEIKSNLKWLKENGKALGGAMKVRELALKNPEFGKLMEGIISKSFGEDDTLNTDFVSKTLKTLEAKADVVEDRIEDKDEDIEEAEALLEELDPDSSQAMILKKNIKIMKAQKEKLKGALSKIDNFASKLEGIDKKNQDAIQAKENETYQAAVNAAEKVFKDGYTEATKEVAFINDSEKQQFEKQVKKLVAGQADKIANDDDYKRIISESVKIAKKNLEDYHQEIRNDYLRKKNKLPKEEKKQNNQNTETEEDVNQESLEKFILSDLESGNS